MPENRDSDFKWDEYVDHYDKDLADNLGNFINRVVVLTNSYFDGKVPAAAVSNSSSELIDKLKPAYELVNNVLSEIENFNFRQAASSLMELSSWGNQYLQDSAPWAVRKTDPEADVIKECLFVSLQIVSALSVLTEPFIPFTSNRIRQILNLPKVENGILELMMAKLKTGKSLLPAGHQIGKPEILFAKIHDRKDSSRLDIINKQKAKLEEVMAAEKANERPPIKEEIQFDDFTKLDIRTGTVLDAEAVEKADKLLKLSIDIGIEKRTVVSGIAKHFKPEEVVGKKVLLLANLAPRKLRGVVSQGMVLMVEDADGKLGFVNPDGEWADGLTIS